MKIYKAVKKIFEPKYSWKLWELGNTMGHDDKLTEKDLKEFLTKIILSRRYE